MGGFPKTSLCNRPIDWLICIGVWNEVLTLHVPFDTGYHKAEVFTTLFYMINAYQSKAYTNRNSNVLKVPMKEYTVSDSAQFKENQCLQSSTI